MISPAFMMVSGEIGPWRNRPLEKSAPKRLGPISPEKSAPIEILEKSSLLSNFTYIDVECYSHCS